MRHAVPAQRSVCCTKHRADSHLQRGREGAVICFIMHSGPLPLRRILRCHQVQNNAQNAFISGAQERRFTPLLLALGDGFALLPILTLNRGPSSTPSSSRSRGGITADRELRRCIDQAFAWWFVRGTPTCAQRLTSPTRLVCCRNSSAPTL